MRKNCSVHVLPYKPDLSAICLKRPLLIFASIKVKTRNMFSDAFHNAKLYLDGAEYFATNNQYKQAAFFLHQATEQAIRGLLASLSRLTSYGHNLKSLVRHSCFCVPDLDAIFPKNTNEEKKLFNFFNAVYVNVRYSPNYELARSR